MNRFAIPKCATLVVVALLAALAALPSTASADTVYGWGNPVIAVNTGAKNYANHTQYVSSITILDPRNHCDWGTAEAWTYGFYKSTLLCQQTFIWIDRWVPSGNNVCGSNWFRGTYANGAPGWFHGVTCIVIRV
jgi:hypothetical protein